MTAQPKWQLSRHLQTGQLTWLRVEKPHLDPNHVISMLGNRYEEPSYMTNVMFDGHPVRIRACNQELLDEFADDVKMVNALWLSTPRSDETIRGLKRA